MSIEEEKTFWEEFKGPRELSKDSWRFKILEWTFGSKNRVIEYCGERVYKHYCPLFHLSNLAFFLTFLVPVITAIKLIWFLLVNIVRLIIFLLDKLDAKLDDRKVGRSIEFASLSKETRFEKILNILENQLISNYTSIKNTLSKTQEDIYKSDPNQYIIDLLGDNVVNLKEYKLIRDLYYKDTKEEKGFSLRFILTTEYRDEMLEVLEKLPEMEKAKFEREAEIKKAKERQEKIREKQKKRFNRMTVPLIRFSSIFMRILYFLFAGTAVISALAFLLIKILPLIIEFFACIFEIVWWWSTWGVIASTFKILITIGLIVSGLYMWNKLHEESFDNTINKILFPFIIGGKAICSIFSYLYNTGEAFVQFSKDLYSNNCPAIIIYDEDNDE